MGNFNIELAVDLILKGVSPAAALEKAMQSSDSFNLDGIDLGGTGISGNLPGIPDIAEHWVPTGNSSRSGRSNIGWGPPVAKLSSVPDPACVAEQLKGNANPTREDVERAFSLCIK